MALALLAAAALGLFGAVGTPARAAPATPRVVFGPPAEGSKLTLGDTSIGGPALWSLPGNEPQVILAWTGTDPAHHVNIMTGGDGFHYGAKYVLPDTSPYRPAVLFDVAGRGSPYGTIVVAWAGTDPAHTLNVAYYSMPGFRFVRKLTLWGETTTAAPSVTVVGEGATLLAWTGTDAGHRLNTQYISPTGVVGAKHTFTGWGSLPNAGPDLSYDPASGRFLLAWTGPNARLYFATSADAASWALAPAAPLVESSVAAPSMRGLRAVNMPVHWLAWTGTDSARHLNVQYTESFPSWFNANSKTTFAELALGGPALGYIGEPGRLLVAWTGTDPAHHLNVAVVVVRS